MKSDIELFIEYDKEISGGLYSKGYYTIGVIQSALSNEVINIIDLDACKEVVADILNYLVLKKRYNTLKKEAGDALKASKEGFKLHDSTFTSLEDTERAWKMKAFL